MDVMLTEQETRTAAHAGVERRLRAIARRRVHRYGWDGEGVWNIDIQAAGSELAVAKLLGRYWCDSAEPDSEGDVGERVQVRWTPRRDGRLILHPDDPDDHFFFLVVGELPQFTVPGWIRGADGKRQEWWRTDIWNPAFLVPQAALTAYRPAVAA